MFEASFFDRHSLINYQLFRAMKTLQQTTMSINTLSRNTGLSYSQTYTAFQTVLAQLNQILPDKKIDESNFAAVLPDVSIDRYRFSLLKNSLPFEFFDGVFKNPHSDFHAFKQHHQTSISTLRRRISPFRDYLADNGVTLNSTTWAIEGDELHIRLAMFTFFTLAYRGAGWPFSTAEEREAKALLKVINQTKQAFLVSPIQPMSKEALLILAIQMLRINCGHALLPNRRMQLLFDGETELPDLIFTPDYFPNLSASELKAEKQYYYFSRMYFMTVTRQPHQIDYQIMTHFQSKDNLVNRFVRHLVTSLNNQLKETKSQLIAENQVMIANLYRLSFTEYVLNGHFSQRLDFASTLHDEARTSQLTAKIRDCLKRIPKMAPESIYADFTSQFINGLYILVNDNYPELNRDMQMVVNVLIEHDSFVKRDLLNFLNDLGFIRVVPPTEAINPDLIITTLTKPKRVIPCMGHPFDPTVPLITWSKEPSNQDYFHLFQRLKRLQREQRTAADTNQTRQ
ncbi:helix-turn-helix domain-containing protein [Lacticaseibacillus paracasei]|uniref:helix-turn-helix domain-containing protein n=1 Tax=Lacticaseibacillus paracasei TaxID=1597 RepID=UPI0021C2CD3C|nr:helix-turn-helix domain-containing protein [Lacticaseibacillus paracasei]MCP9309608.1 helix-turn-helix domain-containing protein [Lacticaseibacillus paracasei]MCP9346298.1 helix-turn-helix domain-containing protein [Lacticaseibacillus paracasei]MCP9378254.1 helix-turn-helix domain-containing protein [Lacticaseibacillus paracasei]